MALPFCQTIQAHLIFRRNDTMRTLLSLLLALLTALSLSGCGLRSGEELYQLPKASEEYESLQTCLEAVLDQGLEYTAPLTGSNLQSVQLMDLDNDGNDEALAFFRDSSDESQSLKIYIFRQTEPDHYTPAMVIEGNGTAINTIVVCQLQGDVHSMHELLVSWQLSPTVYALSAYSLDNYTLTEMLSSSIYTKCKVEDLNQDGNDEIVLLQLYSSDQDSNRAEYYVAANGVMTLHNSVPLSKKLGSIDRVTVSSLPDQHTALYVTGAALNPNGEISASTVTTDILAVRDEDLTNISIGAGELNSSSTLRNDLTQEQDINSDGILEIPIPSLLESYGQSASTEKFYSLHWQQYQLSGAFRQVCSTYHNTTDSWYLVLPDHWTGHISLMRTETSSSLLVEHSIVFYYRGSQKDAPKPFLAIYKTTGSDRQSRIERAQKNGRFLLRSTSDAIYSAELFDCDWDCGLSEDTLSEQFHLIQPHWSNN